MDRLPTAVNREIQELGRYSVKEYNRKRNSSYGLKFTEVVEAETQVVSGIKYYLKISTGAPTGVPKIFEAVASFQTIAPFFSLRLLRNKMDLLVTVHVVIL
ncbi:hypothetical protein RJ639_036003 [Escallonia herrerae]|uniref:Cystatin domain-containing protein n=1 Tax=Escallonia herrerae TaxID=1293975 RepID=A0AA88WRR6_9ASTE|nr:hypothetical protein RJ639_036003 [Escallonia herrerae]